MWDITKNFRGFCYSDGAIDAAPGAGTGGDLQPTEGTSWLNFAGLWGDRKWPTNKFGQYCLGDECHIGDGPTGKHPTRAGTFREPFMHHRSPGSPDRSAV